LFFQSGLTKIANWDSTVSLFENEYAVPLLAARARGLRRHRRRARVPGAARARPWLALRRVVLFVFNIVAVSRIPTSARRPEGPPDLGPAACW
jgi:putative oxidoreductase